MLKETITYKDYNDLERTEDFYFNLNKAELLEMQATTAGGLLEMLRRIVATNDMPAIFKTFKDIILKSFGVKSPDGKYFNKIDPVDGHRYADEFVQTEAYSVLLEKLLDAKYSAKFIKGIIPAELSKDIPDEAPKLN